MSNEYLPTYRIYVQYHDHQEKNFHKYELSPQHTDPCSAIFMIIMPLRMTVAMTFDGNVWGDVNEITGNSVNV